MRTYFSILFKVISAWFLYVFGIKSLNKKLYYSSLYLFSKQSFRLPQSSRSDVLIIFKTYVNTLKSVLRQKPQIHNTGSAKTATLDSSFGSESTRLQYLNYFNVNIGVFLSRENLTG